MRRSLLGCVGALCVSLSVVGAASAQQKPHQAEPAPRPPHQVLAGLMEKMKGTIENSGKLKEYLAYEVQAGAEVERYIAQNRDPAALTAAGDNGQTPLIVASGLGFPDVVAALLKHPSVVASINAPDKEGYTAWVAATMSFRRAFMACDPRLLKDAQRAMNFLSTARYYLEADPYPAVRKMLEKAGAKRDMAAAKRGWDALCPTQTAEVRDAVASSKDVMETVTAYGDKILVTKLNK